MDQRIATPRNPTNKLKNKLLKPLFFSFSLSSFATFGAKTIKSAAIAKYSRPNKKCDMVTFETSAKVGDSLARKIPN